MRACVDFGLTCRFVTISDRMDRYIEPESSEEAVAATAKWLLGRGIMHVLPRKRTLGEPHIFAFPDGSPPIALLVKKDDRHSRVRHTQAQYLKRLQLQGWRTRIVFGSDEAIAALRELTGRDG